MLLVYPVGLFYEMEREEETIMSEGFELIVSVCLGVIAASFLIIAITVLVSVWGGAL
jgi:hypothetical protein